VVGDQENSQDNPQEIEEKKTEEERMYPDLKKHKEKFQIPLSTDGSELPQQNKTELVLQEAWEISVSTPPPMFC